MENRFITKLFPSFQDYTKVDRSAAYAARWVAKSLVKAGVCRRCLVQVREKETLAKFPKYKRDEKIENANLTMANNFDILPAQISVYKSYIENSFYLRR